MRGNMNVKFIQNRVQWVLGDEIHDFLGGSKGHDLCL